jgi:hypothetical protein
MHDFVQCIDVGLVAPTAHVALQISVDVLLTCCPSACIPAFSACSQELDSMQRVQVGGTIGGEHRKQQMAE